MFKFTRVFLLFQLLFLTVNGADQNSLVDVKSDVEAFEEDLIEDPGTKRGQEIKRHPQYVRGAEECCPDIYNSLEDVKSQIADLRAKLGEQFEWSSSHDDICPRGFTYLPLAKSCYKVVFEKHDWTSADKKCQNFRRGSHLVAISSEAENSALKTFLASELSKNVGNTACISREWPNDGNFLWTSGRREFENNCQSPFVWKLSSGKQLSVEFTNWVSGQPNCGGSNGICVILWPRRNFGWNDMPCNMKICPVCEYKP